MKKISELMKDIDEISQIPFKLKNELGDIYISPSFNNKELFIEHSLKALGTDAILVIGNENKNTLPLLSHCIINALKENNNKKRYIVEDILKGKDIKKEDILGTYPFLYGKFSMITVFVEKDIESAFVLIKECYDEEQNIVLIYQDKVLILGQLEDIYDHAISIRETVSSNISCRTRISYINVSDYTKIKEALLKCNEKISVAIKFNLEIDILGERDIIFEEIVESIDSSKKDELIHDFHKGFKRIDTEITKTIDIFFRSGLNLSEASKELYIHRNTLIYRIEKIEKYTGFDIRNFNEAVIFKMIFTLWKEKNKTN